MTKGSHSCRLFPEVDLFHALPAMYTVQWWIDITHIHIHTYTYTYTHIIWHLFYKQNQSKTNITIVWTDKVCFFLQNSNFKTSNNIVPNELYTYPTTLIAVLRGCVRENWVKLWEKTIAARVLLSYTKNYLSRRYPPQYWNFTDMFWQWHF